MKISSEHINNLLAYARERHGAPCRVELKAVTGPWDGGDNGMVCEIYSRYSMPGDAPWPEPIERILI